MSAPAAAGRGRAWPRAVRSGAVQRRALRCEASLARIDATDGRVNAFTDVHRERALRRGARRSMRAARARGERAARCRCSACPSR